MMNTSRTEQHLSDVLRMLMAKSGIQSDNELTDRLEAFENGQSGPAISQPTISRILNGSTRDPRAETVRRLSRFFGVTESQMRGLEPIEGAPAPLPETTASPQKVAEASRPYPVTPPGEPGAAECLALLADFARLSVVKRKTVSKLAHDLRHRNITEQTPLYTLEEISRAVQASLFPDGIDGSQQQEQALQDTMTGISHLLNIQKAEFFSQKTQEQSHKM